MSLQPLGCLDSLPVDFVVGYAIASGRYPDAVLLVLDLLQKR